MPEEATGTVIEFREDQGRTPHVGDGLIRDLWLAEANIGRIWFPRGVTDRWAQALTMALRRLRGEPVIEVLIDCDGGEGRSFEPCRELWWRWNRRLNTISTVLGHAHSVGLSYSVCATTRLAYPDAHFMVHGEHLRIGPMHENGHFLEDHYAADWLARFTKRTYEEWLAYIADGVEHGFGVDEALEWGVIDEVLEGV
jgi:ATP-dependent protease ClpP protease subunit